MFNFNTRSITFNLILLNIIFFVSTLLHPQLTDVLSLHYLFNRHHYIPDSVGFQPYQFLTYMFMHGGFLHILFNMWGLLMFGSILEQYWGARRFLSFYLITGLGAAAINLGVQIFMMNRITGSFDPTIIQLNESMQASMIYVSETLGASGAIFGILTAFTMLFPNTEMMIIPVPVPIKAKYLIVIYILFELFSGIHGGDNVAHFAHLGGALIGFIMVKIFNNNRDYLY